MLFRSSRGDLVSGHEFADDADLAHPWVAAYRIPLTSRSPRWRYEVAVVSPANDGYMPEHARAELPTEAEAQVIGSYIDFRRSWYSSHWAKEKLERPLDVDEGTNTVVLLRTSSDWAYARASWTDGPAFVRSPVPSPDVTGLFALLDHINRDSSSWEAWKSGHTELFPAAPGAPAK